MYHVYLFGLNGKEKFHENTDSAKAIGVALDWKAESEYNVAEVYHITGDSARPCVRVL